MSRIGRVRIIMTALCAFVLTGVVPAGAQDVKRDTVSLQLYFRSGEAGLDMQYRENGVRMEALLQQLHGAAEVSGTVKMRAGASLEGSVRKNRELAAERADNVEAWLRETAGVSSPVERTVVGEDWETMGDVVRGLDKPWTAAALDIIDNCPEFVVKDGKVVDSRKKRLMELSGEAAWNWLSQNCFAGLRKVELWLPVEMKEKAEADDEADAEAEANADSADADARSLSAADAADKADAENAAADGDAAAEQIVSQLAKDAADAEDAANGITPEAAKKMILALRTNLLLPALNVGAELPIGDHWSVGADWYYPWLWRMPDHKDCFQAVSLGLEGRYWFGERKQKLTGHSLGLFSYAGYYDFELDYKGYQGEFASVGLDYLYSLPLKSGLRMEFSFGAGYLFSLARSYQVYEEGGKGYKDKDMAKRVDYWGPLKATVSLVVPIYCKAKK